MEPKQEIPGQMVWLDQEVIEEFERALQQGVMGSTINEIVRQMLRLPRGVFSHPTSPNRGPSVRSYKGDR